MENQILFALIIFVVLFFVLLYFLVKSKSFAPEWKSKVIKDMSELDNRLKSGDLLHAKSALIDADKVFSFAMKSKHIKGETTGERLKNAKKYYSSREYNEIWEAHKLRNNLVHDVDFQIMENNIKRSYSTLRNAIYKLLA